MKEFIRNFFVFTSGERKGTITLAIVLLILLAFRIYIEYRPARDKITFNGETLASIEKFTRELAVGTINSRFNNSISQGSSDLIINDSAETERLVQTPDAAFLAEELYDEHIPFFFDPNTATMDELRKLGLSTGVSRTLINYRNNGGRFREPEDLRKIYGITADAYEKVRDYIRIGNPPVSPEPEYSEKIEINNADSASLTALRGIGPVLAVRIIKYRNLLGGFYDAEQLKEVYGIEDSLYNSISRYIYADSLLLKRIKINQATESELSFHPYIGTYFAEGIISYRDFKGKISGFNELILNNLLPEENILKIMHYIDF